MSKSFSSASKFAAYAKNNYSQTGEDGIIEKILEHIPDRNNWCVELGAWNGIHLSNTYNLIKNKNYKSVLIEANKRKFQELKNNLKAFDTILINEFVMFSGANTLDNILSKTKIPRNFDFLSIDIDGNDYYILESLSRHKPKIICIEYNQTIPNEVSYIQPKDFNVKRGASARAISTLARSKGYSLAAVTRLNLILVDTSYLPCLGIEDCDLSAFRDDSAVKVFAFVGFDGRICLSKPLELIWHDLRFSEEDIQPLPKVIRKFRSDYNIAQRCIYALFILIKSPRAVFDRIKRKYKG